MLVFTDNGKGMSPSGTHLCLSFGHCDKVITGDYVPIGHYGNGFKSGTMRLGSSAVVFTRNGEYKTIGLLSQTFLEDIHAEEVLVPLCSWPDKHPCTPSSVSRDDLNAILKYSPFRTVTELEQQFTPNHGTRIFVYELKQDQEGDLEFNFDRQDDIILVDLTVSAGMRELEVERPKDYLIAFPTSMERYSLRAYCSVLYLNSKMFIFIRNHKVHSINWSLTLFKPMSMNYHQIGKDGVPILFGFNRKNKHECGAFIYHRSRLILMYQRYGIQNNPDSRGLAVIAVVNCDYLKPTHNKQDFILDPQFRLLTTNLATKLSLYWNYWFKKPILGFFFNKMSHMCEKGPFWLQCSICTKWRRVARHCSKYQDDWCCRSNEDTRFNTCDKPEESPLPCSETPSPWVQCTKCKKYRKMAITTNLNTIPEDWTCADNVGLFFNRCSDPQECEQWAIEFELGVLEVAGPEWKPRALPRIAEATDFTRRLSITAAKKEAKAKATGKGKGKGKGNRTGRTRTRTKAKTRDSSSSPSSSSDSSSSSSSSTCSSSCSSSSSSSSSSDEGSGHKRSKRKKSRRKTGSSPTAKKSRQEDPTGSNGTENPADKPIEVIPPASASSSTSQSSTPATSSVVVVSASATPVKSSTTEERRPRIVVIKPEFKLSPSVAAQKDPSPNVPVLGGADSDPALTDARVKQLTAEVVALRMQLLERDQELISVKKMLHLEQTKTFTLQADLDKTNSLLQLSRASIETLKKRCETSFQQQPVMLQQSVPVVLQYHPVSVSTSPSPSRL
ncbi:MORC family CW-type zinc finger protein 3-like [Pelomyxa schiedti]|nr:MORC family CW-type zinc finger protein 3-like [Pelomyxa schiedti]